MKKPTLKTYLIALSIFFLPLYGSSQVVNPYRIFDIGMGANMNSTSGDAETLKRTVGLHLNFNYNIDPYTNFLAEVQFGQLAGGDSAATFSGRQFTNQFNSVSVRGQMQLGKLFYRLPKEAQRVYISSGIGGIANNITNINRESQKIPGYSTIGKEQSINLFIPARLGYEFPVKNAYRETILKIDLAYQHNFVLGDDIDGFAAGKFKDAFSQFSIGFKTGLLGRRW